MDINKVDICNAILTLKAIGKKLPGAERLKGASNTAEAEKQLIDTLVQLWHDIFLPMHVPQGRWQAAIKLAALTNTPNSQVITPGLMKDCLRQIEQEDMAKQEEMHKSTRQEEKDFADGVMHRGVNAVCWTWFKKTLQERADLYRKGVNAIAGFALTNDQIVELAKKAFNLDSNEALREDNLMLLKCWANDRTYAAAYKVKPKTAIAFDDDGSLKLVWLK